MEKRGQIAIFVIIALVIVSVIIAIFVIPGTNINLAGDVNPSSFLRDCMESSIDESLAVVSNQGGSLSPKNYVLYQDNKIEFLCYTSDNYVPCVVQQPLLVRHVESEMKGYVEPIAKQCVTDLEELYRKRGYEVTSSPGEMNLSLVPGHVEVEFLSPMTVSKEQTQTFSKFAVSIDSEIYDLLLTATSIIDYEATLGDSEPLTYLAYYPDLRIDKINRDDGVTIYKLSNVVSGDEFSFASRSLVFPAGYGAE